MSTVVLNISVDFWFHILYDVLCTWLVTSGIKSGENLASNSKEYKKNVNILQDLKNNIRIFAYK